MSQSAYNKHTYSTTSHFMKRLRHSSTLIPITACFGNEHLSTLFPIRVCGNDITASSLIPQKIMYWNRLLLFLKELYSLNMIKPITLGCYAHLNGVDVAGVCRGCYLCLVVCLKSHTYACMGAREAEVLCYKCTSYALPRTFHF